MPVLSESTSSSIPGLDVPYVFIGGSLLVIIGVLISRKSKSSKTAATMSLPPIPEKSPSPNQETYTSPPMSFPQHHHPLSRPPQPLPFTPPTLSPTIFPAPPAPLFTDFQPSSPSSGGLNASYYQDFTSSPIELEYPPTNTSEPPILSSLPNATTTTNPGNPLPRRRSYTKTLSTSSTSSTLSSGSTSSSVIVNGEVIQAEGWRRHTRVFGGEERGLKEPPEIEVVPWTGD
ncbi:hypothetical protein N431DRAFT_463373 [Stipitochalara longipes BDJ]|nr:hypothetical protein N431DRAFT_463373 [Stipitochalara longipes BDJ]